MSGRECEGGRGANRRDSNRRRESIPAEQVGSGRNMKATKRGRWREEDSERRVVRAREVRNTDKGSHRGIECLQRE